MKDRHSVVCFLAGILVFWGGVVLWKTTAASNGSLLPIGQAQAQTDSERPVTVGELEAVDVPVTVPRPLEVPKVYAFDRVLDAQTTQVIIIDSEKMRICVYHVDQNGKIEFMANRNCEWDVKIDDFNGKGLTPSQIQEYYENNRVGK